MSRIGDYSKVIADFLKHNSNSLLLATTAVDVHIAAVFCPSDLSGSDIYVDVMPSRSSSTTTGVRRNKVQNEDDTVDILVRRQIPQDDVQMEASQLVNFCENITNLLAYASWGDDVKRSHVFANIDYGSLRSGVFREIIHVHLKSEWSDYEG